MARRSAYSTVFGSCDISKSDMPALLHDGLRFDWARASAVVLCLAFWAAVATVAYALLV